MSKLPCGSPVRTEDSNDTPVLSVKRTLCLGVGDAPEKRYKVFPARLALKRLVAL